jgi:mono/diheme cytochrome c family protein
MSKIKKTLAVLGCAAAIAAVGAGIWAYRTFDASRSSVADDTVALADLKTTDEAAIQRGEYVMRTADCSACHTSEKGFFAGDYQFVTPFGILKSSNITPDRNTGIGSMTERDFFNAVRQGRGSHGLLYPAMPYTAYVKMTDREMHDLWAYMSTVKPVSNDVDENGGMDFPYNIRGSMAGWNMLFFDNSGFSSETAQIDAWNRGKYLVDGPGHCAACHSPRNSLGAEVESRYLQGGSLGVWYAPDVTSNPHVGIGTSSVDDIARYLQTGTDGVAVAAGPMAEAVEHSTQYLTDEDAKAIGTYLKSLPSSPAPARKPAASNTSAIRRAALAYEVNCSACHGLQGEGIKGAVPAFKANHGLLADDATNLIHVMLRGARAPHTHTQETAAGMPAFDWKMDDQQIAEVLTFVRNSWGNGALRVVPTDVARLRDVLKARDKIMTVGHDASGSRQQR